MPPDTNVLCTLSESHSLIKSSTIYELKFKKRGKHVFVITLLFSMCNMMLSFSVGPLAAVYEIVRKPIVLSTYRLSIHLFYFRSECLWCETLISGEKDI